MPQTGHFILHSNVLPQLTAGFYDLVSTQTGLPFDVAQEHTHVTVSAPRFTMPTDQILSTFPPANAEGSFGDRLPQIVLKRRTLPWERNPAEAVEPSETPWLALVVVAEGEAELSTATPIANCVTAGTVLLDPEDHDVEQGLYLSVTETVLRKIFPTKDDLALLTHVREVDINDTELANGDDDGWLAVVLANRLPVADEATGNAVRYMACLVNVEGQLDSLPVPKPPVDHFTWELAQDWTVLATVDPGAVPDMRVMGGLQVGGVVLPAAMHAGPGDARAAAPRAAAPQITGTVQRTTPMSGVAIDGTRSIREPSIGGQWKSAIEQVNSVALDPDAKRLVRDRMASGFRLPIEKYALEKVYRFPVLAHWSFTTSGTQTFETLMRGLDVGLLGTTESTDPDAAPAGDDAGAQPAPPARPAPEVVETGHIGLSHRTRRGDATRAWYRGPFVPFPTKRDYAPGDKPPPLAHDADQLRRVVPDGREDLSLSAAFEIGRLLGLSQLSVVSALLRFRADQFGAARVRELLQASTDLELPPVDAQRFDLGRFVALGLIGTLAEDPLQKIGPRRPVADPGRAVNVNGDLDQVIADGLGIDLSAVRKTAEELGIVGALAQARVPVADPEGSKVLDARGTTALHNALNASLTRVAGVAAPNVVAPPPVLTHGLRAPATPRSEAEPTPDPLDHLIGGAAANDEDEEE
jgi:hypothetical protein